MKSVLRSEKIALILLLAIIFGFAQTSVFAQVSQEEFIETVSTLDNVLLEDQADEAIRIDANSVRTRTFTFSKTGRVSCTALLSTRNPASLRVTINTSAGRELEWMRWSRQNDGDPSPLYVFGRPVEGSMFNRGGNDFSPNETRSYYNGEPGDKITMTLEGNVTERTFLRLEASPAIGAVVVENPGEDSSGKPGSSVEVGGSPTKVFIPFDRDWVMDFEGTVTGTSGFARLIHGNEKVHSRRIDIFTAGGRGIFLRLANKVISFTSASVGRISNPGSKKDHWLETTVGRIKKGQRINLKLVYKAGERRIQVFFAGNLVADALFDYKRLPAPQTSLDFPNSRGKISVSLK